MKLRMKKWLFYLVVSTILYSCKTKNYDGIRYTYYPTGKLLSKYIVRNRLIEDTAYTYYPSGKLFVTDTWQHNKLNGKTVTYYENGRIRCVGKYNDSIKSGIWFYYDSLSTLISKNEFFEFNHKSYVNNRFVHYKDSSEYALKCMDYSVIPKINMISGTDTIYDFSIYLKCHVFDSVRLIYGMKDIGAASEYRNADTLYSSDGHYEISKINLTKSPNLLGEIQCYEKTDMPDGKKGTKFFTSYFLLVPRENRLLYDTKM